MDILCARFVPAINNGGCQPAIMERPMTDEKTLPPLTLDDVAVYGPDRDAEEAFDPSETWIAACAKISDAGYDADTVAEVLLTLPPVDLQALGDDWRSHCQSTHESWEGRALWAADIVLARALRRLDPAGEDWPLPYLDPDDAADVRDERDDLKAENAKLRALLKEARDLIVEWGEAHVYNIDDGDVPGPDDQGPSICAAIDAALGTEGTR